MPTQRCHQPAPVPATLQAHACLVLHAAQAPPSVQVAHAWPTSSLQFQLPPSSSLQHEVFNLQGAPTSSLRVPASCILRPVYAVNGTAQVRIQMPPKLKTMVTEPLRVGPFTAVANDASKQRAAFPLLTAPADRESCAALKKHYGYFRARTLKMPELEASGTSQQATGSSFSLLLSLAQTGPGLYTWLWLWCGQAPLCVLDRSCRLLCALNDSDIGPWRMLGRCVFGGLEHGLGNFDSDAVLGWRSRYQMFRAQCSRFSSFLERNGQRTKIITSPNESSWGRLAASTSLQRRIHANEVIDLGFDFCRERMETVSTGVYLEIEVLQNPDNLGLSLVLVGHSPLNSLTFCPEFGYVDLEWRTGPHQCQGFRILVLPYIPGAELGERFLGRLGVFLRSDSVAFYRRSSSAMSGQWETSGFFSFADCGWNSEHKVRACIAFRDEGTYSIRQTRLSWHPPISVETKEAPSCSTWQPHVWEV
eukprot:TRINITY_DN75196_c0_g1_i1.p1 TRINITY_DN75196_c0_g1~~TRINITY_DN75196_c0_g1_i1.p1  ORF type:complete len:476 (+),score=62.26 TRINITY_DN75196_c0_g1_i1:227-1654(+)